MNSQQSQQNKTIRGYIMRMLAQSPQNTLICHQLSRKLIEDKLDVTNDISKHLEYLQEKKYIQFVGKNTAYITCAEDGPVSLTATGIDLVEGSITDPGVDI